MSKRKETLAINSIKKTYICVKAFKPDYLSVPFDEMGVYKPVQRRCFESRINTLESLYYCLDILPQVYSEIPDTLVTLARYVRRAYNDILPIDINFAVVDLKNNAFIGAPNSKNTAKKQDSKKESKKTHFKQGDYAKVINLVTKAVTYVGKIKEVHEEQEFYSDMEAGFLDDD